MTRALLLSAALSVGGLAVALLLYGEARSLRALLEVPVSALLLSALLTLVNHLCGGLRLTLLARAAASPLPFRRALRAYLLGRFGALVTPGGGGQTPVVAFVLTRDGLSPPAAWAAALYTVILDLFFFSLSVPLSLLVVGTRAAWFRGSLVVPALALSLLFLGLWYLLSYHLARVEPLLGWAFSLRPLKRWRRGAREFHERLLEATALVAAARPGLYLLLFTLTAALHLANYAVFYAVASSLGLDLSPARTLATVLLASVAAFAVPTPGGSGAAEVALLYLFGVQSGTAQIAPALVVWRALNYYLLFLIGPILGGAVLFRPRRAPPRSRRLE